MKKLYILLIANLLCVILNAGIEENLVVHFALDEGTDTIVTDSKAGITGVILDNAEWIDGLNGKAVDFTNTDTAVILCEPSDKTTVLDFDDASFTVAVVVKNENLETDGDQYMVVKGDNWIDGPNGNGNRFAIFSKQASIFFAVDDDITKSQLGVTISGIPQFKADDWNVIVGVRDRVAATLTLYVNGEFAGSLEDKTGPIDTEDQRLLIGNYHHSHAKLKGAICDVQIFDKALTAEEVATLPLISEEVSINSISNNINGFVYPNPASNELFIHNIKGISKIEIFNILGQTEMTISEDPGSMPLNISELKTGQYILRVHSENSIHTTRFYK